MNNKKYFILFIVLSIFILTSCKQNGDITKNEDKVEEVIVIKPDKDVEDQEDIIEHNLENVNNDSDDELIEIIETDDKIVSKLDGLFYDENEINKRPIAVMFDNHPSSRWQAGISEAEIVYECEVEYPYTRYLAIFLSTDIKTIGSIRSARPYFISYALEYDPIYVHVGGSMAAMEKIQKLNVADLDGLYSGAFFRFNDTGKSIPNNMYSSLEKIRRAAISLGYRKKGNYEGYDFNLEDTKLSKIYSDAESAEYIKISYNIENNTEYIFDEISNCYFRKKDGEIHIDEENNERILANNILIIKVKREVLDNEGRLQLETIGEGNGQYITKGEIINISWKKTGERDKTYFYDDNNNEIKLNPGKTWIQIVSDNNEVIIKEDINE